MSRSATLSVIVAVDVRDMIPRTTIFHTEQTQECKWATWTASEQRCAKEVDDLYRLCDVPEN